MSAERIEIPVDPEVFAEWMAPEIGDEGATSRELKKLWNCGDKILSKRIDAAKRAGVLRVGWRVGQDIAGRQNRVPVYSFVSPAKKRKARTA